MDPNRNSLFSMALGRLIWSGQTLLAVPFDQDSACPDQMRRSRPSFLIKWDAPARFFWSTQRLSWSHETLLAVFCDQGSVCPDEMGRSWPPLLIKTVLIKWGAPGCLIWSRHTLLAVSFDQHSACTDQMSPPPLAVSFDQDSVCPDQMRRSWPSFFIMAASALMKWDAPGRLFWSRQRVSWSNGTARNVFPDQLRRPGASETLGIRSLNNYIGSCVFPQRDIRIRHIPFDMKSDMELVCWSKWVI